MTDASFEVEVSAHDAQSFATISGDWNPLHTDAAYAATTQFGRPILHGAFSAGLVSRMAGMYIPGTDCLLHGMQLKFLQPIVPPARLHVSGRLVGERGETGRVVVEISDAATSRRYVDASYEFGRHRVMQAAGTVSRRVDLGEPVVLVTGASGGLGRAVVARLGPRAVAVSRSSGTGAYSMGDILSGDALASARVTAIIHCGWPAPDNSRLTKLGNPAAAVDYNVSQPLQEVISLAQLLKQRGTDDALLLLVGSTAAEPGRHNYRMPLYTLAKALIPVLCRILAVELGASGQRCAAVTFDVIDSGMNKAMSPQARLAHADRAPTGALPGAADAAEQLVWMLSNRSFLLSGATIALSGGALP